MTSSRARGRRLHGISFLIKRLCELTWITSCSTSHHLRFLLKRHAACLHESICLLLSFSSCGEVEFYPRPSPPTALIPTSHLYIQSMQLCTYFPISDSRRKSRGKLSQDEYSEKGCLRGAPDRCCNPDDDRCSGVKTVPGNTTSQDSVVLGIQVPRGKPRHAAPEQCRRWMRLADPLRLEGFGKPHKQAPLGPPSLLPQLVSHTSLAHAYSYIAHTSIRQAGLCHHSSPSLINSRLALINPYPVITSPLT